jgi:HD-GYP domain-containing protein (c-di-GMP phosphodiesterase class II)
MDVAIASEFVDGDQVYRVLNGDGASFGFVEGGSTPLGQTYCRRVLTGRLPNLIQDTRADERASRLPITESAGIAAFASAPLTFSDGRQYGTLCAASHDPKPGLGYRELQFLQVFAGIIAGQLEREELQEVARRNACESAVTETLIAAVGARDAYTAEHSREVVSHAVAVARRLGLSDAEVADVSRVAMLHDVGKISIPDAILMKPGPLDDDEWAVMRMHPVFGEKLISSAPGLEHLTGAIRAEHERWDGTGYPDGIAGDKIPLASRITLVCDAYHAMITDRPYRRAHSREEAWGELMLHAGTQFDPGVVEALLQTLAEENAGPLPSPVAA